MKLTHIPVVIFFCLIQNSKSIFSINDTQQVNNTKNVLNATELILSKGLPAEEHYVTTNDGFVLGLQRIKRSSAAERYPILILHGLLASSDTFLLNSRHQSLPYVLHDAGFDVWLGNVRGNKYSRKHVSLNPNKDEFWKWSFDEMGEFDIPAIIDYIVNTTKMPKVNFVGHSQGCVAFFSGVIQNNYLNEKVDKFFALAPAAFLPNIKIPLKNLRHFITLLPTLDTSFEHGEILKSPDVLNKITGEICNILNMCSNSMFMLEGNRYSSNLNLSRISVYKAHEPSGTSLQNIKHWTQMVDQNKKKFGMRFYDNGYFGNYHKYKSFVTPKYNFEEFRVSTYIFCGTDDKVVTMKDCKTLSHNLPNVKQFYEIKGYNHFDFPYAFNAPTRFFNKILKILLN